MKPFRAHSKVEQLASYFRKEIQGGGWDGEMPGVAQLVRRLGVGTTTVVAAMEILKKEGVIEGLGERRRSRIAKGGAKKRSGLHVCILLYDKSDLHDEHTIDLKHRLEQLGHRVTFVGKTLSDVRFDLGKVMRIVVKAGGDAWIIRAGPRPVLEWFAEQPLPAFAMFGRHMNIPIAGLTIHKAPAVAIALERLVALGHRRIVIFAREERRKPTPAMMEQQFLNELERLGIEVGDYNLPDWDNDTKGFHRCLDSLFRFTPPTAIFPGDSLLFFATQQYLLSKRIAVPGDVSLVALDDHPAFAWFTPEVSHIRTDARRWVARVVEWIGNVAQGKEDRRNTLIRAEFVDGGTIGPAAVPAPPTRV